MPSPLPSSTQALQSPKLTTAKSGLPSPLKSATAMQEGPCVAPATYSVWGLNNGGGDGDGDCANAEAEKANRKDDAAAAHTNSLAGGLFVRIGHVHGVWTGVQQIQEGAPEGTWVNLVCFKRRKGLSSHLKEAAAT